MESILFIINIVLLVVVWNKWKKENPVIPPKLFWTLVFGWFYLIYYYLFVCKISFSDLCKKSNTITLTWGTFEGHGTNENGERAVIKGGFPNAIGEASKFGFKVVSNGDGMVILQK
jgi:hypothetical protein